MIRRRWLLSALAALAIIGAGAYYWEFLEAPEPDAAAPFDLDMTQVRRLADSLPGDHPTAIRFEHVMDFQAPLPSPSPAAVGARRPCGASPINSTTPITP